MKVTCSINYTELENDEGREVDGVVAECGRCSHETQSFGTGENSVRRCLVLMREECPNGESNFYVADDSD
jgi:hypothetical protein